MLGCADNPREEEEANGSQFLILGEEERIQAVPLPLTIVPEWVANSTIVSRRINKDSVSLEEMAALLPADIVESLKSCGITVLFPIQKEVIPRIVEWNVQFQPVPVPDVCISSPTGSGKTLCYVVPIVHFLRDRVLPRIRALIILPTADLASQVFDQFVKCTRHTTLSTVLITGQQKFQNDVKKIYKETDRGLIATCDILVATPGRLQDHLHGPLSHAFCLTYLRFLVLDEADRLLADYDLQWFKEIDNAIFDSNTSDSEPYSKCGRQLLPPLKVRRFRATAASCPEELLLAAKFPLQKFLVSATLAYNSDVIYKIGGLFRPRLFRSKAYRAVGRIGPQMITFPQNLDELFIDCEPTRKPLVVYCLLSRFEHARILCFTETLRHSHRLCELLRLMGKQVGEISGYLRPVDRSKIKQSLNNGKLSAIVCTQIMARGISFDDLGLVICYDPARTLQEYAHMAGRTARAGKSGIIITLMSEEEKIRPLMDDREAYLINRLRPFDFDLNDLQKSMTMYAKALKELKTKVDKDK
ncbi:ATP dependent RNA helicase DDX51 [Trichuris trichiura]|uniref:ATP-dependent RNA helicase n=1 Tax=Trichuris trichiura TaxID=36087 RepID=A0A077YWX8_TRITR|nr:ATP dependent RNA helicase DDX51 [Trichuris trichiura]